MADEEKNEISLRLEGPPKACWYHGRLSRFDAESILDGQPGGSYLVRESTSKENQPGTYVISYKGIRNRAPVTHFRITPLCGEYYVGGRQFSSLSDLVAYYTSFSELLDGEKLLHPVPPDKEVNDDRYVRAVLPYKDKLPDTDELQFEKGDVFLVCNQLGDGWLWAVNQRTHESGIIYQDLVMDIESETERIEDLNYYHSLASCEEARDLLIKAGASSYLVRPSDTTSGDLTLLVFCDSEKMICRFRIQRHGTGFLMGGRTYTSVSKIIERYTHEPICCSTRLMMPVNVNKERVKLRNNNHKTSADVISLMRQSSAGVSVLRPRRQDNTVKEGYLYMKKADSNRSKKFKKYYFVLNGTEQQIYYIENPKRSKPDGVIDLNYSALYPVHETLHGRDSCIRLDFNASHHQEYYLYAETPEKMKEWKKVLQVYCRNTRPRQSHARRGIKELHSLRVNILEAKNISERISGSVYCQISLNDKLAVAKTQIKDAASPVWDEEFLLEDIPADVDSCTVSIYSKSRRAGNKDQEIYQMTKRFSCLQSGEDCDEWLQLLSSPGSQVSGQLTPSANIRVKMKYQHEVILPLKDYSDLREVLLSKDFQSVSALGSLCDNASDRINLAQSLLKIFKHENKEAILLKTLNSVEIAREDDVSTLFRGTSLATTLMDQYMKMVASDFVKSALLETIRKIIDNNIRIELEPAGDNSTADVEQNRTRLIGLLNEMLQNIIAAKDDCPRMLSHVCYCLQRNVSKRWPENEIVKPRVVSGFIFLRLLCPAIINPKAFHLVADVPPPEIQDTLKLVAKSLMNLANLVEVGAKGQVYMEAIGPFIVDNKQRMVAFLNDLSDKFDMPDQDGDHLIQSSAQDDIARELGAIQVICSQHLRQLQERSRTQPALKKLVAAAQELQAQIIGSYS